MSIKFAIYVIYLSVVLYGLKAFFAAASQRQTKNLEKQEIGGRVVQYTRSITSCQTGDGLWWIATMRHCLPVRGILAIEHRPPHLYECLFISERGILSHFFHLFNCLVCESLQPVANHHTFWQPVTDQVYWTCMIGGPPSISGQLSQSVIFYYYF